jgi:polar amino acid transport system substrate-binding protein
MKRRPMLLVALTLISAILAACGGRSAPATVPSGTDSSGAGAASATVAPGLKARIGMDSTYPPFENTDLGTKQLVGFDVELMQAIGQKAGLDVELYSVPLPQLLTAVSKCEYDGAISAISVTDDLRAQMNFSKPYFTFGQVVAVKSGNSAITGRDKLAGRTVGVQRGSSGEGEVGKIAGAQPKRYENFELAFIDLKAGMIDAVVTDKVTALGYAGDKAGNLKIAGGEWANEDLAIAVCKDNPELLKRIDAGLAAVKSDGTLAKLRQKWLDNPVLR